MNYMEEMNQMGAGGMNQMGGGGMNPMLGSGMDQMGGGKESLSFMKRRIRRLAAQWSTAAQRLDSKLHQRWREQKKVGREGWRWRRRRGVEIGYHFL